MQQPTRTELERKYQGRILGVCNYMHKEYRTPDFEDLAVLEHLLEEVNTGESDITPAGKEYLRERYGFDHLATFIQTRNRSWLITQPNPYFKSTGELEHWLHDVEPMETCRFIEVAKGTITDDTPLDDRLLPPQ